MHNKIMCVLSYHVIIPSLMTRLRCNFDGVKAIYVRIKTIPVVNVTHVDPRKAQRAGGDRTRSKSSSIP